MSLIKKFILTALLSNIPEALFRSRSRKIVKEINDKPITDLSPAPDEGQTLVDSLDAACLKRDQLQDQLLKNTEEINKLKTELNDTIVYDWMPDVQKFCNGDVSVGKAYGFGIKGEYDAEAPSPITAKTSFPSIVNVGPIMHLQATIDIVNNVSKEIVMPDDAKSVDIYEYVGDEVPAGNYRKTMHYVGQACRGKFTAHFDVADVGKNVHLLAAYMPKNQANANELASKVKFQII